MIVEQDYTGYTAADHNTWSVLFQRQGKAVLTHAAGEFKKGFSSLSLDPHRIPMLEDVNRLLATVSGWSLVPVTGLVPNDVFFGLLIQKRFPITVSMRSPGEIDFAELPDIFHDVYGHVPMLMNELFCEFMSDYSHIAINYLDDPGIIDYFGRFYWFTLEMGLIREDDLLKPYGAAILTSAGEIRNIQSAATAKRPFDLHTVITTRYDNLHLQKEYFYIDSFDQLFDGLKGMQALLDKGVLSHQ
ncbi:phenylalanine 4-monooxygenase [Flavitalea sp. BT771]|uniref:phenylalanine 4-monooxygenase n=1 Tax=Flavitalea sp. BT771 TaxID=3063329 RepID=UPI0026E26045|nr:phenylalanine 4-monooxygenase [Flavitalea sp. BT771]MDO6435715.1 phenylalanine 4-monooxygenase [Flavitalea sp. BT771]MDV6224626.1 phenylalanine 4-monooxygenase [Flavitalea sp. BT771]